MDGDDVAACEQVWHETWAEMRERFALPRVPVGPDEVARMRHRLAYLLRTDPEGSWVAVDEGGVVGVALADAEPGREVELNWITAANQWAVEEALAAGLELHPVGPLLVRGVPPPAPYLPNGMLG